MMQILNQARCSFNVAQENLGSIRTRANVMAGRSGHVSVFIDARSSSLPHGFYKYLSLRTEIFNIGPRYPSVAAGSTPSEEESYPGHR